METYINIARALGAVNIKAVTPDDIVFDGRTLLKCMFGCENWGRAQGEFLKPWDFEPLLRQYQTVLLIHAHDKKSAQAASLAIEREAYLDGDVMAFSMANCAICETCTAGTSCHDAASARPALHSVGIDVFTTAKKLGLPLYPLREISETENWYAAVWLSGIAANEGV